MKKFEYPTLEVVEFETRDIIMTSPEAGEGGEDPISGGGGGN